MAGKAESGQRGARVLGGSRRGLGCFFSPQVSARAPSAPPGPVRRPGCLSRARRRKPGRPGSESRALRPAGRADLDTQGPGAASGPRSPCRGGPRRARALRDPGPGRRRPLGGPGWAQLDGLGFESGLGERLHPSLASHPRSSLRPPLFCFSPRQLSVSVCLSAPTPRFCLSWAGGAGLPSSEPWQVTHGPVRLRALVTLAVTRPPSGLSSDRCQGAGARGWRADGQTGARSGQHLEVWPCPARTVLCFPLLLCLPPEWPGGLLAAAAAA